MKEDGAKVAKNISRYAATDKHEYFAESLAAYLHPNFKTSGIKLNPTLEKLFGKVFGPKRS